MNSHDKQRRTILHGALMTCCAVAMPVLITGCDSRRDDPDSKTSEKSNNLPESQTAGSGSSHAQLADNTGTTSAPTSAPKLAKDKVGYRNEPNGTQQCGSCLHFDASTSTCKLVQGQVSANGWCTLWAQK